MDKFKLVQVAITYGCNKNCDFCYAMSLRDDYEEMSLEDYKRLLGWFKKKRIKSFNLTGGEPTGHPHFREFIELASKQKFKVTIFTNGLFASRLLDSIPKRFSFLINYNQKDHYSDAEHKLLHDNLKLINKKGFSFNFMFIITDKITSAAHIVNAAQRYRPKNILIDFAMPNMMKSNAYLGREMFEKKKDLMKKLAKELALTKIPVRVSRPLPYCIYKDSGLRFYSRCGAGESIITINPDLSIFPCLSLFFKGPKILNFESRDQIVGFYKKAMHGLRWKRRLYPECERCIYLLRKRCQGSCLCYKCAPFHINDYGDFAVYSQYSLDKIKGIVASIRKAIGLLTLKFGTAKKKSRIYIFQNKDDMKYYSSTDYYPDWVSGFVAGNIYYHHGNDFNDKRIVHELCHIFINNVSRNKQLPNWFTEGLCEYVAFKGSVTTKLKELMKKKQLIPFKDMPGRYRLSLLQFDKDRVDDNIAYQQSASMVRFIIKKYGFKSILRLLKSTGDFYKTFRRVTGNDFYKLEKEWLAHRR